MILRFAFHCDDVMDVLMMYQVGHDIHANDVKRMIAFKHDAASRFASVYLLHLSISFCSADLPEDRLLVLSEPYTA